MTAKAPRIPGCDAIAKQGWWKAHKYLILRRFTQLLFLTLFMISPFVFKTIQFWIIKGTLATSELFDYVPLSDPFVALQSIVAGHPIESTLLIGAGIILTLYWLLGGRTYCAWVCPINPVTDLASWLRRRLGMDKGLVLRKSTRYWLVTAILIVCFITGAIAWEQINPITTLHRMLLFTVSWMILGILAIFLFDLFIARNGWCGHLCPVGAFYGLIGKVSVLRVSASGRDGCDDCLDCFTVCPEPQVIAPALRGARTGQGPVIKSGDCYVCGRCIDVCHLDVFRFTHRFDERVGVPSATVAEDQSHNRPVPAGSTITKGDGR